jgi:hypothetical protein
LFHRGTHVPRSPEKQSKDGQDKPGHSPRVGKEARMTRPILIAGLLGGLLGSVISFAANRWIVPSRAATTDAKPRIPIPQEARTAVEWYIAKLEALQYEEFATEIRRLKGVSQEMLEAFVKDFQQWRKNYHGALGNHTGPFELIRETAVSTELVQFVYLEKFESSAVVWFFVFYQTKEGWRLVRITWKDDLFVAFPNN